MGRPSETVQAISDFVSGCKTDGVWDKITEAYLMAGVTFGGITVKLKYLDIGETDLITPTLLNGGFETAGGGGADVFADFTEFESGTSTITRDTVEFDTGSASCRLNIDASNSSAGGNWGAILTIGKTYNYSLRAKSDSGSPSIKFVANTTMAVITVDSTEWTTYSGSFVADAAGFAFYREIAANRTIWIDSITLTEVPTKTLTNNNFVTGDYLGVGTGAGLTGDGSTKYLDTGLNDNTLSADDKSFGVYRQNIGADNRVYLGSNSGAEWSIPTNTTLAVVRMPNSDAQITASFTDDGGHIIGSRRGVNDVEMYANGSSVGTDTSTVSATNSAVSYYIFARNGTPGFTDATLTFAHIGTGLTDTDASNLSTRVNTLMTALGCNVY